MVLGGVVIGAAAGYLFWRDHRSGGGGQQARISPAMFGHGVGLTFTVGGAP